MSPKQFPHLEHDALEALDITAEDIIAILEHLIRGSQSEQVWAAPKAVLTPPDGRYTMATLAMMDDPPLVATKSLLLNARNSEIGLPQINSLVTLLHGQTGVPVMTMDGNWVTAVRTAGLSALAAKHMANPDAATVAFIGTGTQARSHLTLFHQMFPLKHVKIFGRGQANIDRLGDLAAQMGLQSEVSDSPEAAMASADLVVTSVTHTSVEGPFLSADWLAPGSFAAVVDLAVPWHKETFGGLDRVVIDDLEQEMALPTKLADPAHVHGDLTGLVTGAVTGRGAAQDRTAFVFRGHALGDLALAALVYQTARKQSG